MILTRERLRLQKDELKAEGFPVVLFFSKDKKQNGEGAKEN